MREGWKEVKIEELGTIGRGKSKHRPRNANFLFGDKYPFVQTADVKGSEYKIYNYSQMYSEAGLAQSKLWPKGTLCITIAANIADAAILGIDACFPDSVVGFIPNPSKSDVRFVKYLFDLLQVRIKKISQGAAQDNLSLEKIRTLNFQVPPLETQKKIASILSGYDDLIENNLKRIKILEEMAQQTYEEWFVRMRFPGHESVTINSETGLPEGWEKKKAHDIFKITIGKTPPRGEDTWFNSTEDDNKIKWASITDIRNSNVFIYNSKETLTKEAIEKYNFNFVKKGNVILSFKLTVGLVAIASEDMTTNEAIAHFNNALLPASYTYYFLKNFDYPSLGSTSSIGTAINSKIVKIIPFVVPEQSLINRFDELIKPMLSSIDNLNNQNQRLREARDILLPRLMMGMIEV